MTGSNGDWNFALLLQGVRPLVQAADLGLCHLETPLGTPPTGYPLFQGPPQIVPALKKTAYDACTTASNHSFDKGAAGIDRTLKLLDQAGLKHAGTTRTPEEAATPTIVVVSCHWGDEYSTKINPEQQALAGQLLAGSNVDLMLGDHAHVVQPIQQLNGKWVVYGLGNLVAAHRRPESTKAEGLLVKITFRKNGDRWKTQLPEYAPLLMTDTLPVRVLDVRRALAEPGIPAARKARLELAERRTTATVTSLGAAPKML